MNTSKYKEDSESKIHVKLEERRIKECLYGVS